MKREVLAAVTVLGLASGPALAEQMTINVLGQPLATGMIQKNMEQPFFENFAQRTGLDIKANYKAIDVTGIKSEETLRVLKNGLFDIVSIRTAQAARDEPFLLGQDLVGLNPDYKMARRVYERYKVYFDERLRERFNAKLLGLWPFGPQVLFCKPEIKGLKDIKGKKVRVYDQSLAQFVGSLGAIPVAIGFSEAQQALARGVVECAITGASSANSAGWPEVSEYFMPIGFQVGFNGYAINLDTWNKLDPDQQNKLQSAINGLNADIWAYSEELFEDALRCNVGKEPCTTVTKYNMKNVPVTDADLKLVSEAVGKTSFPTWSKVCEQSLPGCGEKWKQILGPLVGLD
ncbi:MAG: TRAP transporter substrate-binding protein [Rhodospirillales bacterium]|nr:TRAP transporter substrate-binding protein [Rhodospirillales bacterium]MDH3912107.1 TRAP transporter substrate-binding protein [Rhodospirillales bacterium]MDH3918915.1 TRAP transporter substrate-binding protein [Rhodospirillales bacterium]MDH3967319.1 TRAP transporter substrate-binding protein [Rhodospirillales bacterium]